MTACNDNDGSTQFSNLFDRFLKSGGGVRSISGNGEAQFDDFVDHQAALVSS